MALVFVPKKHVRLVISNENETFQKSISFFKIKIILDGYTRKYIRHPLHKTETFSGSNPFKGVFDSPIMFEFASDGSTTKTGFSANWICYDPADVVEYEAGFEK